MVVLTVEEVGISQGLHYFFIVKISTSNHLWQIVRGYIDSRYSHDLHQKQCKARRGSSRFEQRHPYKQVKYQSQPTIFMMAGKERNEAAVSFRKI